MKQSDCYQLGEVIKTHGLHGEVSILLDVDFPQEYQNLESVFLEQSGKLVPFFIDSIQINGNKGLVKFEELDSIDKAREIIKSKLYLPLSVLPKLEDGQFYYHELVNCEILEDETRIGTVKEVVDLNGNQLIVAEHKENEILIPLKDEIIRKVELDQKKVYVKLPDGLLDVYND